MGENTDKHTNPVQSESMTGNDGSSGNKDFQQGQSGAGNNQGGANADNAPEAQDSDGNTGVMTNDDFEKDEVAGGGNSLRSTDDAAAGTGSGN